MAKNFFQQKTIGAKYSSRYVQSFLVNLPAEKINLYKWVTEMTDTDYSCYSKAHKAMASFFKNGVFHMKNVENIGIETVVQQYQMKYHAPNHVQFYSPESVAYILRWFPATVGVPWEMYLQPVSTNSSRLVCLIGADFPNLLVKAGAWLIGLGGLFLRKHLKNEGRAFAKDIEQKFK